MQFYVKKFSLFRDRVFETKFFPRLRCKRRLCCYQIEKKFSAPLAQIKMRVGNARSGNLFFGISLGFCLCANLASLLPVLFAVCFCYCFFGLFCFAFVFVFAVTLLSATINPLQGGAALGLCLGFCLFCRTCVAFRFAFASLL